MSKGTVVLKADRIVFRSQHDEEALFEWGQKLRCIDAIRGEGTALVFVVIRRNVTDTALRELLALFFRYSVDMAQLAVFQTKKNTSWFANPKSYWFDMVFSGGR
jgi:hypothetical protein